jgi:hypothetical protein
MNSESRVSQMQQNAIWYSNSKVALTDAAIAQLYKIGLFKNNPSLWRARFLDWKPIWQCIKGNPTFGSLTTHLACFRILYKWAILVIIAAIILILVCAFGYFRFLSKTPLKGGWQAKNIFGITRKVMLFDNGKCWIYDVDDGLNLVKYLAIKNSDSSYKVTLFENHPVMVMSVSFLDDNTIQVSIPNLRNVVTMTRIDKSTAKSIMGIGKKFSILI